MRKNPCRNGFLEKIQILRKRPICFAAIGFLLIIFVFLLGRSYKEALYQSEIEIVVLEGKVTDKQYKESSYGGYWLVTLKEVRLLQEDGKKSGASKNRVKAEPLKKLEGKYLCYISSTGSEEIKIGQKIGLEGKLTAWEEPTNPGQFDVGKYYCSQGILGQFKKCRVIWQERSYSAFLERMWQFRKKAQQFLKQELGEEEGAIVSAMLLGEKSSLDESDRNLYQRNGISHILAISGLHLMLLGSGVLRGLKMFFGGQKGASFLAIFIMSLYCVFTGNSISTIRATIMFALSVIAEITGRSYDSLSALGVAAILQLFINPYIVNNSGFWLSFLAVIGVTFLAPRLQELLGAKRRITKSLCISLSASLATLPVLLKSYGTYPWYSVFLNLMILPAMSVLLFLAVVLTGLCLPVEVILWRAGILKGIIGVKTGTIDGIETIIEILYWGIKKGAVLGIKLILKYFEICCEAWERISFQDGYIGAPVMLQIVIYICLIGVAISGIAKHSALGRKMILLSAVSILTVHMNYGVEVIMLDIGQGDSVVIRNSNGNIYLSDCGSTSVRNVGKYRLVPFLKYKGYGKIKGVFLSHADEDHMNGIIELLKMAPEEKIKIEYLFLSQGMLETEEDREVVIELQELAKQNETQLVYLAQGDRITDEEMEFVCLYPKAGKESQITIDAGIYEDNSGKVKRNSEGNRNAQSLVLYLKYKDFDMLLTGDVEKGGELEIADYIDQMSLDVLKVAHHGSSGSSSEELLKKLMPKLSLISCGKDNSYGHPHGETLERLEDVGSEVMSTVESGAITLKIGRSIRVYEFKKDL